MKVLISTFDKTIAVFFKFLKSVSESYVVIYQTRKVEAISSFYLNKHNCTHLLGTVRVFQASRAGRPVRLGLV